jgi:hypothetical protein
VALIRALFLLSSRNFSLQSPTDKKKESIIDLTRFLDKQVRVKFNGGREGKSSLACSWQSDGVHRGGCRKNKNKQIQGSAFSGGAHR